MSKETMRETINTIKSVDGMKAVKVAFDLSSTTMDSVTKVTQVVTMIDDNLKSLAIKVLELEKKYYQGVIAWGPDKGDAYYSKLPSEMEAEAEKMVKEFMDRNS